MKCTPMNVILFKHIVLVQFVIIALQITAQNPVSNFRDALLSIKVESVFKIAKYMQAFEAKTIYGSFNLPKNSANGLPIGRMLEDLTIWKSRNDYNITCTDWQSKATGVWKGLVHCSFKNGIDYALSSYKPLRDRNKPMPISDGNTMLLSKVERPQVYTDKKGVLKVILVAIESKPKCTPFYHNLASG